MAKEGERLANAIADGMIANDAGLTLIQQGKYSAAEKELRKALAPFRDLPATRDAKSVEAALSGNLARALLEQGHVERAFALLKRQAALTQETGDLQGYSNALNGLGTISAQRGQDEAAEHYFEQRLAIARRIGDKKGEGNTLNNMASIYLARRQYGPAIAMLKQRVALAEAIGDRRGQATSLLNLASAYRETSRLDEARTSLRSALALMVADGDPRSGQVQAMLAQL